MYLMSLKISSPPARRVELLNALKLLKNPVAVTPGCLQCSVLEDTSDRGSFLIVEEWQTRNDLVRHLKTDYFRKLLTIIEMSDTPPEVRCEKILNKNGIETIGTLMNHKI